MKRWQMLVFGMAMGLLLTAAGMDPTAHAQGRGQGFRPCPYAPYLCPVTATCQDFQEQGKVVRVLTETLAEGMYPGMALLLDTKTKGRVHVHLGPVWFLERQEFELRPGDEVGVKGVCEKSPDKGLRVIAYELTKGGFALVLRDAQGRPVWEAWRKK
jgi:hypothetical protein